jgi:uncharacterized protein
VSDPAPGPAPAAPDARPQSAQTVPAEPRPVAPDGAAGAPHPAPLVIGVLSDTHGHLDPEVERELEGVAHILHAGDLGTSDVLAALRRIAPVTAVRGNVDMGGWADALPSRAEVELGGVCFVVAHIAPRADGAGRAGQPVVVVAGHSHMAAEEWRDGVLYLNPGSAGPRRFGRPRTLARVEVWPPREADGAPRVAAHLIRVEGD